jgi:hypothetical protein
MEKLLMVEPEGLLPGCWRLPDGLVRDMIEAGGGGAKEGAGWGLEKEEGPEDEGGTEKLACWTEKQKTEIELFLPVCKSLKKFSLKNKADMIDLPGGLTGWTAGCRKAGGGLAATAACCGGGLCCG